MAALEAEVVGREANGCRRAAIRQATTAPGGVLGASAAPFSIGATQVINEKSGLLLYGLAADNLPFQGGVLCVGAPRRRTPLQLSGGSSGVTDCSGAYSFDFRSRIQSSVDSELVAGAEVFAQ